MSKSLKKAVMHNDVLEAKEILKCNSSLTSYSNGDKSFCFHNALYYGHTDIVRLFLKDKRFNFIFSDCDYVVHLYISYCRCHRDTVELVLSDDKVKNHYKHFEGLENDFFSKFCLNILNKHFRKDKIKKIFDEI